jgi:hypothetical protein
MDYIGLTDADIEKMLKEIQKSYLYSLKFFLCDLAFGYGRNTFNSDKLVFIIECDNEPTEEKKYLYRQTSNGKNYFSN